MKTYHSLAILQKFKHPEHGYDQVRHVHLIGEGMATPSSAIKLPHSIDDSTYSEQVVEWFLANSVVECKTTLAKEAKEITEDSRPCNNTGKTPDGRIRFLVQGNNNLHSVSCSWIKMEHPIVPVVTHLIILEADMTLVRLHAPHQETTYVPSGFLDFVSVAAREADIPQYVEKFNAHLLELSGVKPPKNALELTAEHFNQLLKKYSIPETDDHSRRRAIIDAVLGNVTTGLPIWERYFDAFVNLKVEASAILCAIHSKLIDESPEDYVKLLNLTHQHALKMIADRKSEN